MVVVLVAVVALSPGLPAQNMAALQRQPATGLAYTLPELRALAPATGKPGGSADARAEQGEQRQFFRAPPMR